MEIALTLRQPLRLPVRETNHQTDKKNTESLKLYKFLRFVSVPRSLWLARGGELVLTGKAKKGFGRETKVEEAIAR